jgi:hypothetical protein
LPVVCVAWFSCLCCLPKMATPTHMLFFRRCDCTHPFTSQHRDGLEMGEG